MKRQLLCPSLRTDKHGGLRQTHKHYKHVHEYTRTWIDKVQLIATTVKYTIKFKARECNCKELNKYVFSLAIPFLDSKKRS